MNPADSIYIHNSTAVNDCEKAMKEVADGDIAALSQLYQKYNKTVYLIAYAIVKDFSLAEDIMQETFLRVNQKAATYQSGTNLKAWIFSIARSIALNTQAKSKKESVTCELPESLGSDVADKAILNIDFTRAIECLDEQEKTIVILKIGENLRHSEIAKILDISAGDCRMKYSRAIKKMKRYYF